MALSKLTWYRNRLFPVRNSNATAKKSTSKGMTGDKTIVLAENTVSKSISVSISDTTETTFRQYYAIVVTHPVLVINTDFRKVAASP